MQLVEIDDSNTMHKERMSTDLPEGVVGEQEEVLAGLGQEEGMHVVLLLHAGHASHAGITPLHPGVPVQALHHVPPRMQVRLISRGLLAQALLGSVNWLTDSVPTSFPTRANRVLVLAQASLQ